MTQPRRRSFIPGRKLLSVRNVASRMPSTDARPLAVFRYVFEQGGRGEVAARVGDEDPHRAEFGFDLTADRFHLPEARQVAGHPDGLAAVVGDRGDDAADRFAVASVYGD